MCFTRLSLPPPPKTFHREREPMGLRQTGNENEMTSEKKKVRTERKKNCEKEEERGYQRKRGQESKEVRDK
jgi:hypothetical protein